MILSEKVNTINDKIIFILAIAICMILTYMILLAANKLSDKIGTTGLRIIQRIMGIILMVISVQFIIDGLTPLFSIWMSVN